MNRQIARLGLVGVALVAALIVATTYWQTWASAGLADRQDNEIQRVAQFSIKRGLIRASDGTGLWSNSLEEPLGQVFAAQSAIANQVAQLIVAHFPSRFARLLSSR